MRHLGSPRAVHALWLPIRLARCGCAPIARAHGAPNCSTDEADLSGAQLPSSGSASRLPRRFTGLSMTKAIFSPGLPPNGGNHGTTRANVAHATVIFELAQCAVGQADIREDKVYAVFKTVARPASTSRVVRRPCSSATTSNCWKNQSKSKPSADVSARVRAPDT